MPLKALKGAEPKPKKIEEKWKFYEKIGNPIQKPEMDPKTQLAGARTKTMKNLLSKQLKFDEMSHLRCYSGRLKNSGCQMMNILQEIGPKIRKI